MITRMPATAGIVLVAAIALSPQPSAARHGRADLRRRDERTGEFDSIFINPRPDEIAVLITARRRVSR